MRRVALDWTDGKPVLLVRSCARCGDHWYLPRGHCPVCGADDSADVTSAGDGLCVAVTRLHITAGPGIGPVRMVLVELDEGPVIMGRAHDAGLGPGDRAAVAFRQDGQGGVLVPSFARKATLS